MCYFHWHYKVVKEQQRGAANTRTIKSAEITAERDMAAACRHMRGENCRKGGQYQCSKCWHTPAGGLCWNGTLPVANDIHPSAQHVGTSTLPASRVRCATNRALARPKCACCSAGCVTGLISEGWHSSGRGISRKKAPKCSLCTRGCKIRSLGSLSLTI